MLLILDNAPIHTDPFVVLLMHPALNCYTIPYSPELAIFDFLFTDLKSCLRGSHFLNNNEMREFLKDKYTTFVRDANVMLKHRWIKYIDYKRFILKYIGKILLCEAGKIFNDASMPRAVSVDVRVVQSMMVCNLKSASREPIPVCLVI